MSPLRTSGFALIELLVVLLAVGLVTALALPDLERLRSAAVRDTERRHILDQIAGLGRSAMLEGRAYVVVGTRQDPDAERSGPAPRAADVSREAGHAWLAEAVFDPAFHAHHERYAIDLPEGWEIRLDEPLVVYENGVCLGAGLTLFLRGAEDLRLDLEPPYCGIDPDA